MKLNFDINKDKLFFTSDTHFYHENIIKYCDRPFIDLYEMHDVLITNWNNIIPKDGKVFHAGDFALTGNIGLIRNLVSKLNGDIYLAFGNHCYQNRFDRTVIKDIFTQTDELYYVTVKDVELENKHANFIIGHYPFLTWRPQYIHLHGHVHSGPNSTANEKVPFHPMRYDIGVDNNNYFPVSYNDLKVILTKYSML